MSVFPKIGIVNAKIFAKADGVFAGEDEIKYFLVDADANFRPNIKGEFKVKFHTKDGQSFKKGDVLVEISAEVHDLLAVERVVLNLLMRMSGVATFTRKICDMVKKYDVLVTPTRKSLWGLLDKRAVLLGGGGSHRINLSDAILVKDTHRKLMKNDIGKILSNIADSSFDYRFVEVEVENSSDALKTCEEFLKLIKEKKLRTIGVLLLDNMDAKGISSTVAAIKKQGYYEDILLEGSGGINESNVVEFAKTGVDIISMGCLTSGVASIDMSLKIV